MKKSYNTSGRLMGTAASLSPVMHRRSLRSDRNVAATSFKAGYTVPVSYVPLLRAERLSRLNAHLKFDMSETAESLMTPIKMTASATFIPMLSLDRFRGMDDFDRSYEGVPESDTEPAIPHTNTLVYQDTMEIFESMGIGWKNGEDISATLVELYNEMMNHRYKMVDRNITPRGTHDTSIAYGVYSNTAVSSIVPDYDQASIDGVVPLRFADAKVPVKGIGIDLPPETSLTLM